MSLAIGLLDVEPLDVELLDVELLDEVAPLDVRELALLNFTDLRNVAVFSSPISRLGFSIVKTSPSIL